MRANPKTDLSSVELDWYCDVCGLVIPDGTGYVQVDAGKAEETRRAWAEESKPKDPGSFRFWTAEELLAMPGPSPWQALHAKCDPDRNNGGHYWMAVERLRNLAQILDFTAHLSDKAWAAHTNWPNWFYSIPGVAGAA